MTITNTFYRDANHIPIWTDGIVTKKTITFTGTVENSIGDFDGTLTEFPIFTVTGLVYVKVIGVCTVDLTGAASTLEVGINGATTILIPLTTCTTIDDGEIWTDATPATYKIVGAATPADNLPLEYMLNGTDIVGKSRTANTDTGEIDFYCIWRPISESGTVVAA
jgi:hypothetical protein